MSLHKVPRVVDAAAVLNNPADMLLLSDQGKSIRALLSIAGVFPQSEHVLSALAQTFKSDTNDTIRALFGGRVVVMWDGVNPQDNPNRSLTDFIDSQWTVLCEVDQEYLQQIQTHLEPIPRRIEKGVGVYAIEKGRYELVVFPSAPSSTSHKQARTARVVLAPQKAKPLLNQVIASIVESNTAADTQANSRTPARSSIMYDRASLTQGLAQEVGVDSTWSIAWVVQLDEFVPQFTGFDARNNHAQTTSAKKPQPPIAAGLISSTGSGIKINFATDLPIVLPKHDAPVGLLSAVGNDAVFAMALAKSPQLWTDEGSFQVGLHLSQSQDDAIPNPDIVGGPTVILLSEIAQDPDHHYALSMLTQFEHDANATTSPSARVDAMMHGLMSSIDELQAPRHNGRFASAVRTHDLQLPQSDDPDSNNLRDWPGLSPRVSWIASDPSGATPAMILSLSSEGAQTARQVRWIEHSYQTLCAISEPQHASGVLTSGYLRPSKVISMFDSVSTMDLAISKMIDRLQWNVSRAPTGIRGQIEVELMRQTHETQLGKPSRK